jgi:hypothetical protein
LTFSRKNDVVFLEKGNNNMNNYDKVLKYVKENNEYITTNIMLSLYTYIIFLIGFYSFYDITVLYNCSSNLLNNENVSLRCVKNEIFQLEKNIIFLKKEEERRLFFLFNL